tara:strand:+ start:298 stop:531 length:234 start_codon:yes stop_codon:yes gene_type:complete
MSDRPLPRDDMPSAWGWDLIPKIYQKDEKESSDFNFEYEDSYYYAPPVETPKIVYEEYIPLRVGYSDSEEESPHEEY